MDLFMLSAKLNLDTGDYELGVIEALNDGKSLKTQLDDTSKSAKGLSDEFKSSLGANLASDLLKSGLNYAKQLASESLELASNLEEVQNVVDVTFGTDSKRIDRWAKQAKSAFGMGELAAKKYSGTIGAMLKSMGLSSEAVTTMSEDLVALAGDMASFYNLDTETAFEKIRSGIAGQSQPLQQLGINMSVANLEAYAMSQGITKAYNAMSQAEQATLRYNYLMSVTADAQGDFARTSTGYANGVRLLEENIASLKTNVGEALLPIVTDAVNALNVIFSGMEDNSLTSQIDQINQSFDEEIARIDSKAGEANTILSLLEQMETDGEQSTDSTSKWGLAVRDLISTVPELSGVINLQTDTTALRENTLAVIENAKEQARQSASSEKRQAITAAQDQLTAIGYELDKAKTNADKFGNEMLSIAGGVASQFGQNFDGTIENAVELLNSAFAPDALKGLGYDALEVDFLVANYNAAAESVASLTEKHANLSAQLEDAIPYYNETSEAIDSAESSLGLTVPAMSQIAELTADQISAYGTLRSAMEAVEEYRADTLDKMRDSLSSVTHGFEEMGEISEKSVADMIAGLQSQQQYMSDYANNMQAAAELGVDEGLLASLSDGSKESAAYLAAIVNDQGKHIDELNAQWQGTEEGKEALAQVMTDAELAVNEEFQTMVADAKTAMQDFVDAMDGSGNAAANAQATANAVIQALASAYPDMAAEVSRWQSRLSILGTSAYAYVRKNAADASGDAVPITASDADGLSYVPYNDYLSYLHKGEAVLTADQAEDWRAGRSGGDADASAIADAVASAVASALNGALVQMDGQTVGHLVAPTVSSDIADGMMTTGRYAMA